VAAHFCVWHKQPHHVNVAEHRKREKLAPKDAIFGSSYAASTASRAADAREGGDASLELPGSSVSISEDASIAAGAGGGSGRVSKSRWSRKRGAPVPDGEGRRVSGRGGFWDDSSLEEVASSSAKGKGDGDGGPEDLESAAQFVPPT